MKKKKTVGASQLVVHGLLSIKKTNGWTYREDFLLRIGFFLLCDEPDDQVDEDRTLQTRARRHGDLGED